MNYILFLLVFIGLISCARNTHVETTPNPPNEESLNISAKRLPPKEVQPVVINKVSYSATMNEVIATDVVSKNILWQKEIYSVTYEKNLERDVQDVFIDSLFIRDGALAIRNESKQFYFLNLETQEVTQRN